jgi:hypothetical protein
MQMTRDEKIAYEWAIKQQFQSVSARYARVLAEYIKRSDLTPVAGDGAGGQTGDVEGETRPAPEHDC